MSIETSEGVSPHGFHLGTQLPIAESFALEALAREGVLTVALYCGKKLHRIYDYRDLAENPDAALHARLEAQGYAKQHNGGCTHVYTKGNIVVSGADGDLPSLHWYCIGIYSDWQGSDDCWHNFSDWTAYPEFSDMGGPRDLWADLADAELMAARYGEAIADGQSPEYAERDARFFTDNGTADDARWMMADNDSAGKPCPDLHAYCLEIIARNS
jgi:hypothetical protein